MRILNTALCAALVCLAAAPSLAMQDSTSPTPLTIPQAIESLTSLDPQIRAAASDFLQQLAEEHLDISPTPHLMSDGARRLRKGATPEIPKLIAALASDDPSVRACATCVLAAIGPDAHDALPILRRRWLAIREKDPKVPDDDAFGLMLALIRITPTEKPVLPLLLPGWPPTQNAHGEADDPELTSSDLSGVGNGAFYLSQMLVNANRTVQEVRHLGELANRRNSITIRLFAIGMLTQFGPEARDAIPALRRMLADEREAVRICAGVALLHVENDRRRVESIAASLRVKPEQQAAFLEEAHLHFEQQDHEQAQLRRIAIEVADDDDEVAETAKSVIYEFVAGMATSEGATRRQYIDALRQIGPPARSAVPQLIALARDADAFTRQYAVNALWAIDPVSAAAECASDDRRCGKIRRGPVFSRLRCRAARSR